MTINVAINGYGRIGRNILRALYEEKQGADVNVVAINDLSDAKTNAHLTQYDTTHGRFPGTVSLQDDVLEVNGDRIRMLAESDPTKLPWRQLGVDVVIESTGRFASRDKASVHLDSGAKKVLISAPAGNDVPTVVYGVNHEALTATDTIVSNASCTTNSLAPVFKPLHEAFGVEYGLMNTVHSSTNDQVITDLYHKDLRRARSASQNIIPTSSGAARAIGLVMPELDGKLDGFAVRAPTVNVSMVDLTLQVAKSTTAEEVNAVLKQAAQEGPLSSVLDYTVEELVSSDYNHNPASSTVDAPLTKVMGGQLVKVCAWYDNEWGFSNRMLDTAMAMAAAG